MRLDRLKTTVALAYIAAVGGMGVTVGVSSGAGWIALAAIALLPAGALLCLWNYPKQSLSESIQAARR